MYKILKTYENSEKTIDFCFIMGYNQIYVLLWRDIFLEEKR